MSEPYLIPPKPKIATFAPGPLNLLRAVLSNPLLIWHEAHFEELVSETQSVLGTRLVVSDPNALKRIFVDCPELYVKDTLQLRLLRRTTGRSLFTAAGRRWKRQRSAVSPLFRPKRLEAFVGPMDAAATAAVQRNAHGGRCVDLGEEVLRVAVDVLKRTIFSQGIPGSIGAVGADLRRMADLTAMIRPGDLANLPERLSIIANRKAAGVRARVNALSERILATSPAAGEADLPQLLGKCEPGDGAAFSRREALDNISTFIGAGADTSTSALTWSLYLLSRSPRHLARARSEVKTVLGNSAMTQARLDKLVFTRAIVEETMRLYPPAPFLSRTAVRDDTLPGVKVKAGTIIFCAPWVVHRHRRLWENPDAFDPERFMTERREKEIDRLAYIPFGLGQRGCIGARFALQEATIVLARLIGELKFNLMTETEIELRQCVTLQPVGGI